MHEKLASIAIGTLVALLGACSDDGVAGDGGTGSATTGGGDDGITTLPVTSAPPGDDGVGESGAGDTASPGDSTGSPGTGSTEGTGPGSTGGDEDSSSTGGDEDSSTGEPTPFTIEWCRLQSPATATVAVDEPFTVYGRVYVAGVTDQSVNNDLHPLLVAEVGWGADGSDPAVDAWTWVAATDNPGWDGTVFGEPNNDEYMADLSIDTVGTWDYAIRFSGDGGTEWVYCDLDDLLTGGYTPDQAGDATVE
jgi:hypothetical protein